MTKRTVVVGVDGSPAALAAARYALWRAQLSGLDLVVVHAYAIPALQEPLSEDFTAGVRDDARAVLDRVVALLDVPPDVGVRTILQPSSPALLLRAAAATAQVVVIGRGGDGWLERHLSRNLVHSLCTNVTCPVVVVPVGWQPTAEPSRPVVVALQGDLPSAASLQITFEEADLRGTAVLALHAMPANAYPRELAAHDRNLSELLAGSKQDYPQVPVSVQTVAGEPSQALIDASPDAGLIVVTFPHASRIGAWTWSVARGVLGRAGCPVAVVPRAAEVSAQHTGREALAGR